MTEAVPDTRTIIETLFEPSRVIEVRVIRANNDVSSGFYTDREKLFRDVAMQDTDPTVMGIYTVLNEINPDILKGRSPRQINSIAKGDATKTENILRRRWLVLDFDPVKATTESNSSSTDTEKAETSERAKRCEEYLNSVGFPEPIRGDSGNGTHRIYRIDLPNDQKSYDLIAAFLGKLKEKFQIDVTMKDAPRIAKLYGTISRKGINTPERPHRRSRLISVPATVQTVTSDMMRIVIEKETETGRYQAGPSTKTPVTIKEGTITERHTELKPLVFSMVARKNSRPVIHAACQELNRTQFHPPKGEQELKNEVDKLIDWAQKKEIEKASANTKLMETVLAAAYEGQKGVSNLFLHEFKDEFCYDHSACQWYEYQGHSWKEDLIGKQLRSVTTIQELFNQASMMLSMRMSEISARIGSAEKILKDTAGLDDDDAPDIGDLKKKLKKAGDQKKAIAKTIDFLNMLYYRKQIVEFSATGEGSLGIAGTEWDPDPWLLGCQNGVIDLKTGILRDGKPDDYIRSTCPTVYNKTATCPKFEKFLIEICSEDIPTVQFLQRFLGMGLIGDSRYKQYVLILSGIGRNGKDTLCIAINHTLGNNLSGTVVPEMLMKKGNAKAPGSASSDVIDLRGKRILSASETEGGAGFDMAKVKFLSGGGDQKGRAPYGKHEVQFPSSHVLILQTNNRPVADASDYAFWQRVKCVEFKLSFIDDYDKTTAKEFERKKDPNLGKELETEAPGILNWLIAGCLSFQKVGLNDPTSVKTATTTYRDEVDIIKTFIHDECIEGNTEQCQAGLLYNRYRNWAMNLGYKPWSGTRFGRDMSKRFEKATPTAGTFYIGVSLKPREDDTQPDTSKLIEGSGVKPDVRVKST